MKRKKKKSCAKGGKLQPENLHQTLSGEMSKKGLKTGRNGVKFFWGPHTCSIITFVAFFIFNIFRFGALQTTDLQFYGN